ncbi:hypothetical protein D9M70_424750 [compost metagenome]
MHIQRRHLARVDASQGIGLGVGLGVVLRRFGQAHLLELDDNGRPLGVGQGNGSLHRGAVQGEAPAAGGSLEAGLEVFQVHPEALEAADFHVSTAQQSGLLGALARHIALGQLHPGRDIQFVDAATHPQPLGTRQAGGVTAQYQVASRLVQLAHGGGQRQADKLGVVQPVASFVAVQGHAPAGVAGLPGRLAEWRRQVDRQAVEVGVDAQLTVLAVQAQVQAVGQRTRGRQRLADAEPGGEVLQGDAAVGQDARASLAVAPLGLGPGAHFAAEGLAADVPGTKTRGGVVAEGTLEPGEGQLRTGDLQLGVGGGEVDHHMGGLALLQRYVQLQAAVQWTLALPAGEDRAGAHGRLLEDLQAVGEAAVQIGVQQQA